MLDRTCRICAEPSGSGSRCADCGTLHRASAQLTAGGVIYSRAVLERIAHLRGAPLPDHSVIDGGVRRFDRPAGLDPSIGFDSGSYIELPGGIHVVARAKGTRKAIAGLVVSGGALDEVWPFDHAGSIVDLTTAAIELLPDRADFLRRVAATIAPHHARALLVRVAHTGNAELPGLIWEMGCLLLFAECGWCVHHEVPNPEGAGVPDFCLVDPTLGTTSAYIDATVIREPIAPIAGTLPIADTARSIHAAIPEHLSADVSVDSAPTDHDQLDALITEILAWALDPRIIAAARGDRAARPSQRFAIDTANVFVRLHDRQLRELERPTPEHRSRISNRIREKCRQLPSSPYTRIVMLHLPDRDGNDGLTADELESLHELRRVEPHRCVDILVIAFGPAPWDDAANCVRTLLLTPTLTTQLPWHELSDPGGRAENPRAAHGQH